MRFLMFLISSTLLICLVLLVRRLFRRKLSPGVIYALWLIPMIRLLIPFGAWELPVFGAAAQLLNLPYAMAEEWMEETPRENHISGVGPERVQMQTEEPATPAGTKVFEAVTPEGEESSESEYNAAATIGNTERASEPWWYERLFMGVWLAGSLLLGGYVIIINRKLYINRKDRKVIDEVGGIAVCMDSNAGTPCLAGLRKPRILVPAEIYQDRELYECVLQHELAHYAGRDNLWTAIRILMCVIYWWNPFVWFGSICAAEDAELACDARALRGQGNEERKAYGYALLQILEKAENRYPQFCVATSMSGGKKTMKRRIEEIAHSTVTKKTAAIPVLLILLAALVLGCGAPSEKNWIKLGHWEQEVIDDTLFMMQANITILCKRTYRAL